LPAMTGGLCFYHFWDCGDFVGTLSHHPPIALINRISNRA